MRRKVYNYCCYFNVLLCALLVCYFVCAGVFRFDLADDLNGHFGWNDLKDGRSTWLGSMSLSIGSAVGKWPLRLTCVMK